MININPSIARCQDIVNPMPELVEGLFWMGQGDVFPVGCDALILEKNIQYRPHTILFKDISKG